MCCPWNCNHQYRDGMCALAMSFELTLAGDRERVIVCTKNRITLMNVLLNVQNKSLFEGEKL